MLVLFGAQAVFGGVILGAKWICRVCLETQAGVIVAGVVGIAAAVGFLWLAVRIISMLLRASARGRG